MFFRGNEISITAKNKLVVPKFLRKNFMEEKLLIFVICLLACRKDTGL
jgi:DNA-binding transcriptional regulator/RsmH inhibitor MraZ